MRKNEETKIFTKIKRFYFGEYVHAFYTFSRNPAQKMRKVRKGKIVRSVGFKPFVRDKKDKREGVKGNTYLNDYNSFAKKTA